MPEHERIMGLASGKALAGIGRFGIFAGRVGWRACTPTWEIRQIARQTWLVTLRCLLPVVAVVFPFGMVMALQGLEIFELFGAQRLLSSLVSVAVFRELSPVLASVLVAAQGGSAFAAELGAMRIREELDATEIMAIDPLRVHVVPRVLATSDVSAAEAPNKRRRLIIRAIPPGFRCRVPGADRRCGSWDRRSGR